MSSFSENNGIYEFPPREMNQRNLENALQAPIESVEYSLNFRVLPLP